MGRKANKESEHPKYGEYSFGDYPKQPILPGKSDTLHISYQAEHPGHFNKTISIYCNTTSSPILIKIKGNAEK